MPLTDVLIRNAKPKERPYKLHDRLGLYLEVPPSGRKRFLIKYRLNGKENEISLGLYAETTLKAALERRDVQRKLLDNGIDPSYHRKTERAAQADRSANSFEQGNKGVVRQILSGLGIGACLKEAQTFRARYFPLIGRQPIAEIEPPEVLSLLRRIEKRGTLDTVRRAPFYCGQVFRIAVAEGRIKSNPCRDLRG